MTTVGPSSDSEQLASGPMGPLGRATRITLLIIASIELVAMVPCFGILNWGVAPLCIAPVAIGLTGLLDSHSKEHPGPLLAGVVGGVSLLMLSLARLALGAGVF